MSAGDYEIFDVLRKERQDAAVENRQRATAEYIAARSLADAADMKLCRHSEAHYSLTHRVDGWRVNIYPGNHRLWHDPQRPRAPYLRLKELAWGLMDVVRTAIEQVEAKPCGA